MAETTSPRPGQLRLNLVGFKEGDDRPQIVVKALDASGNALSISKVAADGSFDLSTDTLKAANRIVIGPDVEDQTVPEETTLTYRARQFAQLVEKDPSVAIAPSYWKNWFFFTTCVTGSVRHCFPYPWVIWDLAKQASLSITLPQALAPTTPRPVEASVLSRKSLGLDAVLAPETIWPIPRFCEIVCDGVVEVYRRLCCCTPWIIRDPRLPSLINDLEGILKNNPVIVWPPNPNPPDPPYYEAFFKEGSLDERVLNARTDLEAIRSLPEADAAAYIQARPYLWHCNCGTPSKVGEGFINPDGSFNICWRDFIWFLLPNCHWEYAYVVKQVINGTTVTIYNGLAANAWFDGDDNPVLTSYSRQAASCRNNTFPGSGAFSLLQDIGNTGSWQLKTPNATSWDSVAAPAYNDGLVFPAATPAAALGAMLDCNWGGTLPMRYFFSEAMKTIGAKYYRVSVRASDNNGNPSGAPTYYGDGLAWLYYVITSSGVDVRSHLLGPTSAGGESNLYEIPYDADFDWQSGQYHAYLDTTKFADARFLVTLEVFDATGKRLRPSGAPAVGTGTEATAAFTFRRWYQEIGPTADVPFAALTHMFWWDNRQAHCRIVDLRKDHTPSTEECQFLEGVGSSQFSVGYYAYHPNAMFQLYHSMNWHRGLGGTWGTIIAADPTNVTVTTESPSTSFGTMLGGNDKCSFTVNLGIAVKTWNGGGRLYTLDDSDQAAFALEVS